MSNGAVWQRAESVKPIWEEQMSGIYWQRVYTKVAAAIGDNEQYVEFVLRKRIPGNPRRVTAIRKEFAKILRLIRRYGWLFKSYGYKPRGY